MKPKRRLGGVCLRLWASCVPLTLTLTALHSLDLGSSPIRESPLAILLAGDDVTLARRRGDIQRLPQLREHPCISETLLDCRSCPPLHLLPPSRSSARPLPRAPRARPPPVAPPRFALPRAPLRSVAAAPSPSGAFDTSQPTGHTSFEGSRPFIAPRTALSTRRRPPRHRTRTLVSYPILSATLRASAPVDSVVSGVNQAVPQVADIFGIDTSAADTLFVNAASIILPAWGAIVGAIFVFGTVYKIAFPDKYNEQVYSGKAAEMVQDEIIDLDNLSEDDLAAVAELEAERAAQKQ